MKKLFTTFVVFLTTLSLIGCANMSNQDAGTLTGAVAGGLIGSTVGKGSGQVLAIAAGTLAGAYIGGSVGRNMDENDRMRINEALEKNATGQPAYWNNAHTGVHYRIVPVKNVKYRGNPYCREYRTLAEIDGHKQTVYGTACRQPDGSWKAVR